LAGQVGFLKCTNSQEIPHITMRMNCSVLKMAEPTCIGTAD
jgi:hypothetical protein